MQISEKDSIKNEITSPNLVILAWIGDKLSCRLAENELTFDFQINFDLEGQGPSPPPHPINKKIIGILTEVFCISDPNLLILAWTTGELSWDPFYYHGLILIPA